MGVAGSGKSTVARALADELGAILDADDFHSAANVAKMARGEALDDDLDREGWLVALRTRIDESLAQEGRTVLACSALKRVYREKLGVGSPGIALVYIKGSYELIRERLLQRTGHFMKDSMLTSQFAALEEPTEAIVVDAADGLDENVRAIVAAL